MSKGLGRESDEMLTAWTLGPCNEVRRQIADALSSHGYAAASGTAQVLSTCTEAVALEAC